MTPVNGCCVHFLFTAGFHKRLQNDHCKTGQFELVSRLSF
jgi:hypothetical protein